MLAYQWQIEMRATTREPHEWVPMRHESGKLLRYVERSDAEADVARLRKNQPHAVMRIAPAPAR